MERSRQHLVLGLLAAAWLFGPDRVAAQLPTDAGQTWKTYDLSAFVKVAGEGSERHVAYWESVKVVDRIEEAGEDADTTVVREKERFSQRLTLLYADGRIALLSERPAMSKKGDAHDDECTFADGPADLRAADAGYGDECLDPPASPCG